MLGWLRRIFAFDHRRAGDAAQATGLIQQCIETLSRKLPIYRRLPSADLPRLHELIVQFMAEKQFWGSGGLVVTDEMRLLVAAQACILVLHTPHLGLYPRTKEVILYPGEFGECVEAVGPDGRRYEICDDKIGETWNRGPVLLAWDSVRRAGWIDEDGHNVVFHEFAHALDLLDGYADGVPPLENAAQLAAWKHVFTEEYKALVFADRNGRRSFFDTYGATDPGEFFAVVTEQFFEEGRRFARLHPALYSQMKGFYRQDPASWSRR